MRHVRKRPNAWSRLFFCALLPGFLLCSGHAIAQECPGISGFNRLEDSGFILGGGAKDGTVVLADRYIGLSVWSLDETGMTQQGEWLRRGRSSPWGDFWNVTAWIHRDGFALVTRPDYPDVWAFDIRNPHDPKPLWNSGLFPEQPVIGFSADYRDSILALGGINTVLYDLSDIYHPQATVTSILGSAALCAGDLVILPGPFGGSGVSVYRLVPGEQPVFLESSGDFPAPQDVYFASGDDLVLVGHTSWAVDNGPSGVGVVDLADPENPAFYDLSNILYWRGIRDVVFDGRVAYASIVTLWGGYFLEKVDFSDPENPVILKMIPGSGGLNLVDNRLLVTGTRSVSAWDLDLESHETLKIFGAAEKLLFDGDLGIMADGRAGLSIFDVGDPLNFVKLGQLSLGADIWVDDLALRDGYAYLAATDGGLVVVDYSQPTVPRQVAEWPMEGAGDIALDGDLALLATHKPGSYSFDSLEVFDIGDPENPRHLSSVSGFQGSFTSCVTAADGVAYLGTGERILVVDLSDPLDPRELAAPALADSGGSVQDLAISGNFLYATSPSYRGIDVFDISDPSRLELITQIRASGADALAAEGNMVYFTSADGVSAADLAHPSQPVVHTLKALRHPWALTPKDGLLYLAAPPNIEVMSLDCSSPEARFETEISGHSVQFINTSTSWWEEISWEFGDGESVADARDPLHYYESPGSFEVVLSISGTYGDSTFRQTITISDLPKSLQFHESEVLQ